MRQRLFYSVAALFFIGLFHPAFSKQAPHSILSSQISESQKAIQEQLPFFIPLNLRHAQNQESQEWGLMGKTSLEANEGLVFHFEDSKPRTFWAFNCQMDLSIAFLNEKQIIQEIQNLKAYPEKMDPKRPVRSAKDLQLYPSNDPIRLFFFSRAVRSKSSSRYVIEMKKNAFKDLGINCGDGIFWGDDVAYASPRLLLKLPAKTIRFPHPRRLVLEALEDIELHFLDEHGITEKLFFLKKGQSLVTKEAIGALKIQPMIAP